MTEPIQKPPGLPPEMLERLALLLEELGEAQQAVGKILRHGYQSRHPDGGPSNRENLERELGDVMAALTLLAMPQDVLLGSIERYRVRKLRKVYAYLHHQGPDLMGDGVREFFHPWRLGIGQPPQPEPSRCTCDSNKCVRCGSEYSIVGACTRASQGCQGGTGERTAKCPEHGGRKTP